MDKELVEESLQLLSEECLVLLQGMLHEFASVDGGCQDICEVVNIGIEGQHFLSAFEVLNDLAGMNLMLVNRLDVVVLVLYLYQHRVLLLYLALPKDILLDWLR